MTPGETPDPPATAGGATAGGASASRSAAGGLVAATPVNTSSVEEEWMARALSLGESVRTSTSPNPWVGAVLVATDGRPVGEGATNPPGGPHAEVVALSQAQGRALGATLYVTLEPCPHQGRTPPCTDAIVAAGVGRVVVGMLDPDPKVSGKGVERLRAAGIPVEVGVLQERVGASLRPYLAQRKRGRPWVVLKLAATLDGRIAAPDGSSQWITGPEARADAHQLRAESDAVVVGAGTVRADNPALTVRDAPGRNPLRVVLGSIPPGSRVEPAMTHTGDPRILLEHLAGKGVIQVLVEGGAKVAWSFHHLGLVDQYVVYLAPLLLGGDDGVPMFRGPGAPVMSEAWRGTITSVRQLGPDLRIDLLAVEDPGVLP